MRPSLFAISLITLIVILGGCSTTVRYQGANGTETLRYHATRFNDHCRDAHLAKQLRALGPVYAIGASVSYGLFSTAFPSLIRDQMCLSGEQYASDYYFLFLIKSNATILNTLDRLRPRLVIALDFPYHYVKMQYAEKAKPILKKYLLMLLMECGSELIDCSAGGQFSFERAHPYHPIVLAGSIYYDCHSDEWARSWEKAFPSYAVCREENRKLNAYMRELARQYPRLHVLPAFEMVSALHDTPQGVYHYDVNGVHADFKKSDLFVDGFHPWTDPGAYVLANLVIEQINRVDADLLGKRYAAVPYIPLHLPRSLLRRAR